MYRKHVALIVASLGVLGCHRDALQGVSASVVAGSDIEFGSVFVSQSARRDLVVTNQGAAPTSVTLALQDSTGAFAIDSASLQLGGGESHTVNVTFTPKAAKHFAASVELTDEGHTATVDLSGDGVAVPDCTPNGPCDTVSFDFDGGTCQHAQVLDGTPCPGSTCVANGACFGGQCLGSAVSCDDGNPCTVDACVEGQGCVHTDRVSSCPAPADPCQVAVCNADGSCGTAPAEDGIACGSGDGCVREAICVAGACKGTNVPDGTPCRLWWAPCVNDATCQSGACDSPTADAMNPGDVEWSTTIADGGAALSDPYFSWYEVGAMDDAGNSYVDDAFGTAVVSLDACGNQRWLHALPKNFNADDYAVDVAMDRDQLFVLETQQLELHALDSATGLENWSYDLKPLVHQLPDGGAYDGGGGDYLAGPVAVTHAGQIVLPASGSYLPPGAPIGFNVRQVASLPLGSYCASWMVSGQPRLSSFTKRRNGYAAHEPASGEPVLPLEPELPVLPDDELAELELAPVPLEDEAVEVVELLLEVPELDDPDAAEPPLEEDEDAVVDAPDDVESLVPEFFAPHAESEQIAMRHQWVLMKPR